MSERAFVSGATGFIGSHIVSRLLSLNYDVSILTRDSFPLPLQWRDRVDVVVGNLLDKNSLHAAIRNCSIVFHCAAEARSRSCMREVNVTGTAVLLGACAHARIAHIVHLSSVGVMGAYKPGIVDENFICAPRSEYEKTKHESEILVGKWAHNTNTPVAIMRPTIVFGERSKSESMLAWFRVIKSGRFAFIARNAYANYIYIDDLVNACICASTRRAGGVFIVSDPCLLSDFVGAAANALGVRAPAKSIPYPVAAAVAAVFQSMEFIFRRKMPFNLSKLRALNNRTCFQSSTISRMLDWHPHTGYRQGLSNTIGWHIANGNL